MRARWTTLPSAANAPRWSVAGSATRGESVLDINHDPEIADTQPTSSPATVVEAVASTP